MTALRYRPRIADSMLQRSLQSRGAVLIQGPKWCGKTTTAIEHCNSVLRLDEPASRNQNLALAEIDPGALLVGDTPRLLDEWQLAPTLWDAVRYEVDQRQAAGQFILTGSSVPARLDQAAHSGTGRIARMRMRPMSLQESEDSAATISLKQLFDGEAEPAHGPDSSIQDIAQVLCRGGWPQTIGQEPEIALLSAQDYLSEIVDSDISRVDGANRNPVLARAILRSYARFSGQPAALTKVQADVEATTPINDKTLRSYLTALEQIFVIEDLPAWNPNLRSQTAIRSTATRHFVDPSIAAAALSTGPGGLIKDLNTFGLLFESLCIKDLRVYTDAIGGDVFHYRDKNGLEADAVVHLHDGRYGLIEIKLGGNSAIVDAKKSLRKLHGLIADSKMAEPSFQMVLTATGSYAFPDSEGIWIVPITTLGA